MRRHSNRQGAWELPLSQRALIAPAPGRGRPQVFLVAARGRGPTPDQATGAFLRMRVLMLAPGLEPAPTDDEPVIGPLPDVPAGRFAGSQLQHVIQGEILRDLAGRLFERLGEEMRPIETLAIGPRGQLLNLAGDAKEKAEPPAAEQHGVASFRPLLPEPGVQRILNWSEFSELLRPLLAAPGLLCAGHRLACRVQVYRSLKRQTLSELASAIAGEEGKKQSLHVLTPALAAKLALAEVLAKEPPLRAAPADQLAVGMCVVCLQLLSDPTAGTTAPVQSSARALGRGVQAIPERYLKPWEFRFSREEVLYEVNVRQRFAGPLSRLLHGIAGLFRGWGEYRRWQILLQDRTAEEQLWAVRPPRGSLTSPAVRAWAKQTLSLSGSDAEAMLPEWEIFWRRKGV
jgi:hypothetical protein